jgi:hypothetical protein
MSGEKDSTQEQFALTAPPENLTKERKAKKAAANRKWRETHREAKNAYQRAYREKHKEVIAAREKIYRANHRAEATAREKAWREANRDRALASRVSGHMRRMYGLTMKQVEAMKEAQGQRCLCCKTKFGVLKNIKARVDHCHTTGRVRGILCNSCNTTLGHAKDNLKLLRALIRYLERTSSCPQGVGATQVDRDLAKTVAVDVDLHGCAGQQALGLEPEP